jgi:hypothetical protein
MKLRRAPEHVLGVDPSQRHNALAVFDVASGMYAVDEFGGIEEIRSFAFLERLAQRVGTAPVLALIECPTWSGRGTKEVRAAALIWERARLVAERASVRYGPFASLHEAYGVLVEEVDEYEECEEATTINGGPDCKTPMVLIRESLREGSAEVVTQAHFMKGTFADRAAELQRELDEVIDVIAVCDRIIEQWGGAE